MRSTGSSRCDFPPFKRCGTTDIRAFATSLHGTPQENCDKHARAGRNLHPLPSSVRTGREEIHLNLHPLLEGCASGKHLLLAEGGCKVRGGLEIGACGLRSTALAPLPPSVDAEQDYPQEARFACPRAFERRSGKNLHACSCDVPRQPTG